MFINSLPIALHLPEDCLTYIVRYTQEEITEAMKRAHVPIHRIVNLAHASGSAAYSPLFQTMFQVVPGHRWAQNGHLRESAVKVDLEMQLFRNDRTVGGRLIFDQALYEESTMRCWLTYLNRLLASAIAQPEAKMLSHSLMDDSSWTLVVHTWNHTAEAIPNVCVHDLVSQQVERSPKVCASNGASCEQLLTKVLLCIHAGDST